MSKQLPIGIDNYYKLVNGGYLYCDKSLFIEEFLRGGEVDLITRSRRWGKSLNLSMLHHFLAAEVNGKPTAGLFNNTKLHQHHPEIVKNYQGQYPVVFISFKDIDVSTTTSFFLSYASLMAKTYALHKKTIINSSKLDGFEIASFNEIFNLNINDIPSNLLVTKNLLTYSLERLTFLLEKHYEKPVYLLIDEYDAPLNKAFSQQDIHKKSPSKALASTNKDNINLLSDLTEFMKSALSSALKGNNALAKGLLCGILRMSKDTMLSGLNNIKVHTLLDTGYHAHFGFSESEVEQLFNTQSLNYRLDLVKSWYNGYLIAGSQYYNPWSIINCLDNQGVLNPYWVSVANNDLIKILMKQASPEIQLELGRLIHGETVNTVVNKEVSYNDLLASEATTDKSFWSALLATGYLTCATTPKLQFRTTFYDCEIKIPNEEIASLFNEYFIEIFKAQIPPSVYEAMFKYLRAGQAEAFAKVLQEFLSPTISTHDTAVSHSNKNKLETFFHGFMACVLSGLSNTHDSESNREAGGGRLDWALVPKTNVNEKYHSNLGIIFEYKHLPNNQELELLDSSKEALQQIQTKRYMEYFATKRHVRKVLSIGLSFSGKFLAATFETVNLANKHIENQGEYCLDKIKKPSAVASSNSTMPSFALEQDSSIIYQARGFGQPQTLRDSKPRKDTPRPSKKRSRLN